MATSRPIRRGEWLTHIQGHNIGMSYQAAGDENPVEYVRQEDFAIQNLFGQRCAQEACVRIFGVAWPPSEDAYQAAITNGTAPGLYVREGDDTSDWETYRQVLARRVDEAMATRSGVETTATVRRFGPGPRQCSTNGLFIGVTAPYHIEWSGTAMFYMYSDGRREQTETTLEHCLNGVRSGSYVELPVGLRTVEARVGETAAPLPEVAQARGDAAALAAARAMPTATTRQGDGIRVGDVVEVVSCRSIDWTTPNDVGCGGRVNEIDRLRGIAHLESCAWLRLPQERIVGLTDVRKVTSPSPPTIVVANGSPMPDEEANSLAAAVAAEVLRIHDEVRRQMSSPLASGGDEVTIRHVVNPAPPAGSVRLQSRDFTTASVTEYLQSLGATHIHINRMLEGVPVIEVTGLSQQAFDTARQNLPAGVRLRAAVAVPAAGASQSSNVSLSPQLSRPPPPQPTPTSPSRFSLLEVDADAGSEAASPPQARKASVDLGALQAELRAEREAKRALAAAQTPPGRFDLLECDLPAIPATAAVTPTKASRPQRPAASSPPPRRPVETITDLTAARSPLELTRMLEGLNDELSTMMRQREAN